VGSPGPQPRVCVVGPSTRFLSGITYYTYCLVNALEGPVRPSAILMRRLLPRRLYPGRDRVGASLAQIELAPSIPRFDGIDWYWGTTIARAFRFLKRERPDVLVLQWWTGTVLHSYLALALVARMLGIRVVVELHEAQDVGEAAIPVVGRSVRWLAPRLFAMADRYVVHSEFDRELVHQHYGIAPEDIEIIPHAAYEQYGAAPAAAEAAPAGDGPCRLLYFGVIRPFKGVEDLLRAFDALPEDEAARFTLTIVGETWEGHTLPGELVQASRYRDRIRFVNRYVEDGEVAEYFSNADVVVLPYHRSSQSGPLHVAMAHGLPVVITAVGGLVEATSGYGGAVLVQPRDPQSLLAGIRQAAGLRGRRFAVPHSWEASAASFAALARRLLDRPAAPAAAPEPVADAGR
jgi:glycosyltransferase involved in cell wall biosynthesis